MLRRQALQKLDLEACKAMLKRDAEVQRARQPGRHKEADTQMQSYATTFRAMLEISAADVPPENVPPEPSMPIWFSTNFQRVMARILHTQQAPSKDAETAEVDLEELLNLQHRNEAREEAACVSVPLPDVLLGPGHVAWKLVQNLREDPDHGIEFNEEQILVIALHIWPLERAWRSRPQAAGATLGSLQWLPNDLGLPRVVTIGGGGCGKTTIMQLVIVPTLRAFFQQVVLTAPSNRAARGFDPRAKTMHSMAGLRPQDSMRTSSLNIKSDEMRKRFDANLTHAGAWVHDEALQTAAPLLHAAALRATYAREQCYRLCTAHYAKPRETFGRISFFAMCGDHLQLPTVPKSSGLIPREHLHGNCMATAWQREP